MSYSPTPVPAGTDELPGYLARELQALAQSLQQSQQFAFLQTLHRAPTKPREGMVVKADGTDWNPGSGAGLYVYQAGAWVFLGGGGGGAGTVTSVGLSTPNSTLSLGGTNPVVGSGTISADINIAHRNEWTATQNVAQSTLVDASTITPNGALSNNFYLLLTNAVGATRNIALPTSLNPGDVVNFQIKQPSSSGPCLVVFDPASYFWGLGGLSTQPVASTVNSASEFYSFTVQADGTLHGVMIGQSGATGPGYAASSLTSLVTAGSGSKSFTTQAGLAYSFGCRVRATSAGTGEYMEGVCTSYSLSTLVVSMDTNSGTGTHADWNINVAGNVGATGSTGGAGPTGAAGSSSSAGPSGSAGRLTLTTGVPVTTSDVTGATTIYFTPYKGNQIQLWDGANWTTYTFNETTLAIGTKTSGLPYDVFARQVAGVLALDDLAWTNTTTRATAVTIQDGRYCKSGDKTRLYLGTYYTTSTTTTEDSAGGTVSQTGGKRFLWNYYNRVARQAKVIDTTASWAYTTATIRQANAAAGNKVEFLMGISEDQLTAQVMHQAVVNSNSARTARAGIGLDSTTVFSGLIGLGFNNATTGMVASINGRHDFNPAVGYHALNWLEFGGDVGCTFQGSGNSGQSGLTAVMWA